MLLYLGMGFLAGAVAVSARWWLRGPDSLGRPRSFPVFATVAFVLLAGAALVPWLLRHRLEDRLSAATTQLIGTTTEVSCQGFGEAFVDARGELGYVAFDASGTPERKALIKRNQCRDLSDYLGSDKSSPSREQIVAVHVLSHEAVHMSGVTDEAETECLAVQLDARLARLLGAAPGDAENLARSYFITIYPHMPAGYRSDACAPGGALDAHRSAPPW